MSHNLSDHTMTQAGKVQSEEPGAEALVLEADTALVVHGVLQEEREAQEPKSEAESISDQAHPGRHLLAQVSAANSGYQYNKSA